MSKGFLGILQKLSKKKGAVTFQQLSGFVRGFKALPANGKRWKKNESPEMCEVWYFDSYNNALDLCRGEDSDEIAYIVRVPRKAFLEFLSADKKGGANDE